MDKKNEVFDELPKLDDDVDIEIIKSDDGVVKVECPGCGKQVESTKFDTGLCQECHDKREET